jgi:hypothetical protein
MVLGRGGGGRAKVIEASSSEPRPLGDRPAADARSDVLRLPLFGAELVAVGPEPLRPALRRVLPVLLTPVDRHIKHAITTAHRLAPAASIPIRLEDAIAVAQVAGFHPEVVSTGTLQREAAVGLLGHGVPRHHIPPHEVAVAAALVVRALAEDGEGHVAGVQVRQLQRLAGEECAAFALVGSWQASVPHVVRGEQLSAALKGIE